MVVDEVDILMGVDKAEETEEEVGQEGYGIRGGCGGVSGTFENGIDISNVTHYFEYEELATL